MVAARADSLASAGSGMNADLKHRHARAIISVGAVVVALAFGACGGGGSSGTASVGDCIDAGKQVVDCSSSSATQKLVSDQSDPKAIACVQIGSNPQTKVKVGEGTFCAEKVK